VRTHFSQFFPEMVLYVVLAICVALQYNVQRWTRFPSFTYALVERKVFW